MHFLPGLSWYKFFSQNDGSKTYYFVCFPVHTCGITEKAENLKREWRRKLEEEQMAEEGVSSQSEGGEFSSRWISCWSKRSRRNTRWVHLKIKMTGSAQRETPEKKNAKLSGFSIRNHFKCKKEFISWRNNFWAITRLFGVRTGCFFIFLLPLNCPGKFQLRKSQGKNVKARDRQTDRPLELFNLFSKANFFSY